MKKIFYAFLILLGAALIYIIGFTEKGIKVDPASENTNLPDFNKITESAASELQNYLRIKTVRGNEKSSALFLQELLKKENIDSRIIPHPDNPERVNLIAEIPGTEEGGGVILLNHMDVVEVDEKEWTQAAFSGYKEGNRIYGRGAVDMKGLGLMQMYAFIQIKRSGIPLKHKLMFLAVADEETRSAYGARFLIEKHKDIFKGYEFIHNEGGTGTDGVAVEGSKIFNIQYSEKGILWLELTAKGDSGHGSTPPVNYAAKNMMEFLNELLVYNNSTIISDVTAAFFYQMGEASPFPNSFVLKRSRNLLISPILKGVIQKNKHLRAMTSNTVSITGFDSHPAGINVITNTTNASVDIRLLPGVDPDSMLSEIQAKADKYKVEIKVKHKEAASVSPLETKFFKALSSTAIKTIPGTIVAPFLSPGTTDSSYFRLEGFKCYGLIPALLTNKEIDGIHGKDESITTDQLKSGIQILYETILNYNK